MASAHSLVNRSRRPFSSAGLFLFSVDDSGRPAFALRLLRLGTRERTTISFGRSVLFPLANVAVHQPLADATARL
jgi:hypothetical protein